MITKKDLKKLIDINGHATMYENTVTRVLIYFNQKIVTPKDMKGYWVLSGDAGANRPNGERIGRSVIEIHRFKFSWGEKEAAELNREKFVSKYKKWLAELNK